MKPCWSYAGRRTTLRATSKAKQQKKDDEVRKVIREVNELKGEIREIKDMLKGIANGR